MLDRLQSRLARFVLIAVAGALVAAVPASAEPAPGTPCAGVVVNRLGSTGQEFGTAGIEWHLPSSLPMQPACVVVEQQVVLDAGAPVGVALGTNRFAATGLSGGTHTIQLRLRDDAGQWHEWTRSVEVTAPPLTPPGSPTLTIPTYARGARVKIELPNVPSDVAAYRVSTSPAFDGVDFTPLDDALGAGVIEALLDGVGRDGLMMIYAQYRGANGALSQVTSASVTVDRTAPVVAAAAATVVPSSTRLRARVRRAPVRSLRVNLTARDATSGVQSMQITTSRAKPGVWRRYARSTTLRSRATTYYVRARDRAGNVGKWRTVRVQQPRRRGVG